MCWLLLGSPVVPARKLTRLQESLTRLYSHGWVSQLAKRLLLVLSPVYFPFDSIPFLGQSWTARNIEYAVLEFSCSRCRLTLTPPSSDKNSNAQ